jgi:choline dehydrogenase-like flavoprotein
MSENEFDYIVVGGGSAGCLLATGNPYHGDDGELNVKNVDMKYPITDVYMDAAQGVGIKRLDGIDGLRVVDCSVFPLIPSGNTHAPVVAVADRATDLILGKPVLQPEA